MKKKIILAVLFFFLMVFPGFDLGAFWYSTEARELEGDLVPQIYCLPPPEPLIAQLGFPFLFLRTMPDAFGCDYRLEYNIPALALDILLYIGIAFFVFNFSRRKIER